MAHGWSSHALRFFPWTRPLLEAGYAVVAFDQQGHGRSSGREATLAAFRDTLRVVASLLDRVAAVIGHAHGACAAMLALADCSIAERAVLIAAPADPSVAALRFARAIGLSDALSARLLEACDAGSGTDLGNIRAHVAAPRIGCPALIIHDLDDREVPWTDGECLARHWRDSHLLTTTGLGHHRVVNDRAVIDATLRFLRGERVGSRVVSSPNLAFGIA
jgi:pimeloyl-ACP methyl ester carboxylesterase